MQLGRVAAIQAALDANRELQRHLQRLLSSAELATDRNARIKQSATSLQHRKASASAVQGPLSAPAAGPGPQGVSWARVQLRPRLQLAATRAAAMPTHPYAAYYVMQKEI